MIEAPTDWDLAVNGLGTEQANKAFTRAAKVMLKKCSTLRWSSARYAAIEAYFNECVALMLSHADLGALHSEVRTNVTMWARMVMDTCFYGGKPSGASVISLQSIVKRHYAVLDKAEMSGMMYLHQ